MFDFFKKIIYQNKSSNYRKSVCWKCGCVVTSTNNSKCSDCGWLICNNCHSCSSSRACYRNSFRSIMPKKKLKKKFYKKSSHSKARKIFIDFRKKVTNGLSFNRIDFLFLKEVLKSEPKTYNEVLTGLIFGDISKENKYHIICNLRERHIDWISNEILNKVNKSRYYGDYDRDDDRDDDLAYYNSDEYQECHDPDYYDSYYDDDFDR